MLGKNDGAFVGKDESEGAAVVTFLEGKSDGKLDEATVGWFVAVGWYVWMALGGDGAIE